MNYVIIKITNGRYYGASVWTYDLQRAVHFPSKQSAEKVAKGYINVKVISI